MRIYGYCIINQKKQSIDRQIRNIKEAYPSAIMVEEAFTGTKIDRPEWTKLYAKAKSGDTIVFDSVSRMSRNAADGFVAYEELYNRGVNLVFLKEPHINTDTFKKAVESPNLFVKQDKAYTAEGKTPVSWNFPTMPSEEWKNKVGSALTAYAANQTDDNWNAVVTAFVDGWKAEYDLKK